jgi:hypothetical protein
VASRVGLDEEVSRGVPEADGAVLLFFVLNVWRRWWVGE